MFGLNTVTTALSGSSIDDFSILFFLALGGVLVFIYDCIFALFRSIVSFFKKGGK